MKHSIILILGTLMISINICNAQSLNDLQEILSATATSKEIYENKLESLSLSFLNIANLMDRDSITDENLSELESIYKFTEEHLKNFTKTDSSLQTIKSAYGKILYSAANQPDITKEKKQEFLLRAAEYDNADALYELANIERDFNKRKMYFTKCLNLIEDTELKEEVSYELELMADFLFITDNNEYLYCHILSEEEKTVSICGIHPKDSLGEIAIPPIVVNQDKTYTVIKITDFRAHAIWDESFPFDRRDDNLNSQGNPIIRKIRFPNTLKVIGKKAFMWSYIEEIELPKSLRYIGDYAFQDCRWLLNVDIPEGVEEIGKRAFFDNCIGGPEGYVCSLSLPSTLKRIKSDSFVPGVLDHLTLSPDNKDFCLINGALYSADSTYLYNQLIPCYTNKLFIPDTIRLEDCSYYPDDSLRRYEVSNSHKYYSEYKDILYPKDWSSIISIPSDIEWIELHPSLSEFNLYSLRNRFTSSSLYTRKVVMNPNLKYDILYTICIIYIHQELSGKDTESKIELYDSHKNLLSMDDVLSIAEELLSKGIDPELLTDKNYKVNYDKSFLLYSKQQFHEYKYINKQRENARNQTLNKD